LERYIPHPHDLGAISNLSGLVPTVSVVAGASAGHGALTAALSDFVIMVRGAGALFTAGPALVLGSTGERVDPQDLGGADVHAVRSGVVHVAVDDDQTRQLLSYLPSNAWERAPRTAQAEGDTSTLRRETHAIVDLVPADPRQSYDIRPVIEEIVDSGTVFELHREHGESIVTAFARIGGHSVAIIANQPRVLAGSITVTAANKAARFVEIAGSFHLPLLYLADNPGVLAGSDSEAAGILRASARMFAAQHRSASAKVHISMRKVFGFGSSIMALNQFDGRSFMFALPGVTLGVMPAKGGASISNATAETTAALARSEGSGPWKLASEAAYDDVIDPAEMRDTVIRVLDLSERSTRMLQPVSRTGYMP
jgi:acetyl-CoA carboxylase carboxyltransferase component